MRADLPAAGAWLLAFAPVLYLGLRGGGYDAVVRGEIGIAVWWLLAAGALAGVLLVVRSGRATLAQSELRSRGEQFGRGAMHSSHALRRILRDRVRPSCAES